MITDFTLIVLYCLCVLIVRTRLSLFALLAFSVSFVATSMVEQPWQPHAINALLYMGLTVTSKSPVNRVAFAIVIFQYITAWDAHLLPTIETILYSVYPYVSAALNLALIFIITKAGSEKIGTSNHSLANRVFDFQFMATHSKGMRKG